MVAYLLGGDGIAFDLGARRVVTAYVGLLSAFFRWRATGMVLIDDILTVR